MLVRFFLSILVSIIASFIVLYFINKKKVYQKNPAYNRHNLGTDYADSHGKKINLSVQIREIRA